MRNALSSVALSFVVAALGGAQVPTVSGTYVSTLGVDTVSVERFTRTGTKLEGDILYRYPRVRIVHYVADLGDGRFKGMSVASRPVNASPATPPLLSIVTLFGDSAATIEVQRGGRPDTAASQTRKFQGRAAPSAPGLPASIGLYEQVLAFNPVTGRDTVKVSLLGPAGGLAGTLSLVRRGRDTVVLASSFSPGWVEIVNVEPGGRIVSLDATATTMKAVTRRTSDLDFDATAKSWTAVETARGRAGQMSPADTVRATVGAASLEIAYSRPFKRGRTIWGGVVEWGKPWRTGANAATQFTTTADLMFGNALVPAGRYTLWSLPTPAGTKLIINKQTGQWGTAYDQAQDLLRLDMTSTSLTQPVEQFTMAIVPLRTGGVLRFSWDNREYSIPFRVR